jgi:hypothetical protein
MADKEPGSGQDLLLFLLINFAIDENFAACRTVLNIDKLPNVHPHSPTHTAAVPSREAAN